MSPLQFQKQLRLQEARRLMRGKALMPPLQVVKSAMKARRNSVGDTAVYLACRQSAICSRYEYVPLKPLFDCVWGRCWR